MEFPPRIYDITVPGSVEPGGGLIPSSVSLALDRAIQTARGNPGKTVGASLDNGIIVPIQGLMKVPDAMELYEAIYDSYCYRAHSTRQGAKEFGRRHGRPYHTILAISLNLFAEPKVNTAFLPRSENILHQSDNFYKSFTSKDFIEIQNRFRNERIFQRKLSKKYIDHAV